MTSSTSNSKRNQTLEQKDQFYDICLQMEAKIFKEKDERFPSGHRYMERPERSEVLLARKDHICNVNQCGKQIKKGSFYFRRSFGQVWTIKACSMICFVEGLP